MRKKYFTDEERKAARRETNRRYREKHKTEIAEYKVEYRKNNRDKIRVQQAEYRQIHKTEKAEYNAKYKQEHRTEFAEYNAKYRLTPKGRAKNLVNNYRQNDMKYNRGECTITDDWIVDNVFSGQCCNYCSESDWRKLGVDRIDNSKPHTPDNVVPCCGACNVKRNATEYNEFMRMIGKVK